MTGFNCRDPKVIAQKIHESIFGDKTRIRAKTVEELVPLGEELLLMINDIGYSQYIIERERAKA